MFRLTLIATLLSFPGLQAQDKEAVDEVRRLRDEIKALSAAMQLREKALQEQFNVLKATIELGAKESQALLAKLQAENEKLRAEAAQFRLDAEVQKTRLEQLLKQSKLEAEALQARNQQLLKQIQELQRALFKRDVDGPKKGKADPDPLPPDVKGKVLKVEDKSGLIISDLGADQGVVLNQTLEVFRVVPEPRYLGRLRIVEVMPKQSVGRMERSGSGVKLPEIQADDLVASRIAK